MAAKRKYVVRVVLSDKQGTAEGAMVNKLLECFRYAGFIIIDIPNYDEEGTTAFEMRPPQPERLLSSEIWSRQNAERMQSMGFNAVQMERSR